ncbi:Phosphoribosylglycinamide formyltransferase [hydrothermal vent metagenome]|uniref:phosphoribosylglycinamide formyltransferase 1 n=1 Tax=hydrothermal vent metagenome TaxID=652676 RepID=A0A3B0RD28_9ZZZZ
MKTRLGILISGTGSNLQSIAAACKNPDYPAEIALVLTNQPEAKGITFAKKNGLATAVLAHQAYETRQTFEQAMHEQLHLAKVDLVCLAGFMRILSPFLVSRWAGRMLNIHPSLLPAFPGLHTHRRALEAGASLHGCSVHQVTEGLDEGPVQGQSTLQVLVNDTETSLQQRVLQLEHQLYPQVIAKTCQQLQQANLGKSAARQNGSN